MKDVNESEKKDSQDLLKEILGSSGIKNPNFSKNGDPIDPTDPSVGISSNVDFTDASYDISRKGRHSLGMYLSTKTGVNKYSVANPVENSDPVSVNARGAALSQISSEQQAFVPTNTQESKNIQSTGLGVPKVSGQKLGSFFTSTQLEVFLDKTSSTSKDKSGDDLLKKIPTDGISQNESNLAPQIPAGSDPNDISQTKGVKVLQAIHDQLKDGNTYSPDGSSRFIVDSNAKNEEEALSRLFTIQRDLGSFKRDGKVVKVSDMSALAMALIVRSAGNNIGSEYILEAKDLQRAGVSALIPFLSSLGVNGVEPSNLKIGSFGAAQAGGSESVIEIAASATGQQDFIQVSADRNFVTKGISPNNEGLPDLQSTSINKTSYGQLTTFLNPFGSKFSSFGMITLAFAGILIILATSLAFSAFASKPKAQTPKNPEDPQTYAFGEFRNKRASFIDKILEITQTENEFSACVSVGLPLLFGFGGNAVEFTALLNSKNFASVGLNLVTSSGFYANFIRRIVAEGVETVGAFGSVLSVGTNAIGAIDSLLKGIEKIVNSSTFKLIQISAALGDISIKSQIGASGHSNADRYFPEPNSKINVEFGGIEGAQKMSVFRTRTTRWLDGQRPISTLSLRTFVAAQKDPNAMGLDLDPSIKNSARFLSPSKDTQKSIEDLLDAEYMPFYIHDLRNDEIISMPAFITEFSENFNANYNAVKGVGRQDSVRLYQDTERTMNIGFMLVAMNEQDFSHMWHTINRFVAMCYPQYSKGRSRTYVDNENPNKTVKFIQPFSQVQAASPMVRLRVGDVLRSNYSKFGLARLFGAGPGKSDFLAQESQQQTSQNIASQKLEVSNKIEKDLIRQWSTIFQTSANKVALKSLLEGARVKVRVSDFCSSLPDSPKQPSSSDRAKSTQAIENLGSFQGPHVPAKIKSVLTDATFDKYFQIIENSFNSKDPNNKNTVDLAKERVYLVVNIDGYDKDIVVSLASLVYWSDDYVQNKITQDQEYVKLTQQEALSNKNVTTKDFFSSDKNSIVRSFESTRGRGLAGFITSLGLSYEQMNWEIDSGKRGPKSVKITLGFAPIHDLPLGLDYYGDMRNPSHPIGSIAGSFGDPFDNDEKSARVTESSVKSTPLSVSVNKLKDSAGRPNAEKSVRKFFGLGEDTNL